MRDFPGGLLVKTSPSDAGGVGSIPGWGAKIPMPQAKKQNKTKTEHKQQKQYCNKFNRL